MGSSFKVDLESVITDIEEHVLKKRNHPNGVLYEDSCKLVADLCFDEGRDGEGFFYLSEAHAATLRTETIHQYELCETKHKYKGTTFLPNLDRKYIEFYNGCTQSFNEYANEKYLGLRRRLKELPKEWTIVQLTRSSIPSEFWSLRPANCIPKVGDLHVSRFSCGDDCEPCHVLIPEPEHSEEDGTVSILRMLYDITLNKSLHMKSEPAVKIKNRRLQNSSLLKTLAREIQTQWIKEWCFLFLGKIRDTELEKSISTRLQSTFDLLKKEVEPRDKCWITQLAYGCADLRDEHIENVIQHVADPSLQKQLLECIYDIKKEFPQLTTTMRYPVILLIDQKLEAVPWESCPILEKHPVSRLPSIHFAHAIFKLHEDTIVDGNKILSNAPCGFYVINPDSSLQNTDKRITQFLELRSSHWTGVVGEAPSKNDFLDALIKYDILLYCGHGSGTQYLNSTYIQELHIKSVPLLFGCSSVKYKDIGGKVSFRSLSNSYLMAACPCVLGMLWDVTNTDADYMALTLLNHWLPGQPVDLKKINGFSNTLYPETDLKFKNKELLRVLQTARDSARMYTNNAAMVVYGIPVALDY